MFFKAGFVGRLGTIGAPLGLLTGLTTSAYRKGQAADVKADMLTGGLELGAGAGLGFAGEKYLDAVNKDSLEDLTALSQKLKAVDPNIKMQDYRYPAAFETILDTDRSNFLRDYIFRKEHVGTSYDPKENLISLGKDRRSLGAAAKELGRATESTFRKGVQHAGGPLSLLGPIGANIIASSGDPDDSARLHLSAGLAGASQLPSLVEEVMASSQGADILKTLGKTEGAWKHMAPGIAVPAALMGVAAGSPYLANYFRKKFRE